ncbi:class I SAM-dependent methyltransferase [Edaphobacillus lindanitolerans]|uniref:Methyltransferase domain-containing protein n=1 Tax=Edaphobacillus lindanitolerans TaxID=550447 RepID=A0A1U7PLQ8_9BACI|nr:class I SAM-dependent methyltransferase [Edaphobacillus lindanitolerans]SIT88299.1 Methyltransferase domain-containing protein [Edaphobacillus lindanitolerans]
MKAEDNLEKYADPAAYDERYGGFSADVELILDELPERPARIIDLACGTGRISLPIARNGYEVTGVDLHEGMLERAKEKAGSEGLDIRFLRQDCRHLDLPAPAALVVMAGNSFQHFLTNEDQDLLFESVRRHLTPGGRFIFDTRNPVMSELAEPDHYEEVVETGGQAVREEHTETYDPVSQILHCETRSSDGVSSSRDAISLRYTYPLELERLVRQHGFLLEHRYGDWRRGKFSPESGQMVCVCRLM